MPLHPRYRDVRPSSQGRKALRPALAGAMRLSGAKAKKDTVSLALREFAARRRVAALEHYARLAAGRDFERWERRRAAEKDPA